MYARDSIVHIFPLDFAPIDVAVFEKRAYALDKTLKMRAMKHLRIKREKFVRAKIPLSKKTQERPEISSLSSLSI